MSSSFFKEIIKPTILESFKNQGIKFINENYERYTDYIDLENSEGYKYSMQWSGIKRLINDNREFTIPKSGKYRDYNIKLWMERNTPDLKFIETNGVKIYFSCENNHIACREWHRLKTRKSCPECNKKRYIDINVISDEFLERGYIVDKELTVFNGNTTTVIFNCHNKEHGVVSMTYGHFKKGGICKKCKEELPHKNTVWFEAEDVNKLIKTNNWNIKCSFKTEDNGKIKDSTRLQCICYNHKEPREWETTWRTFRKSKYGCHKCSTDKNKGKNNPSWKGGVTFDEGVNWYFRKIIKNWKKESMKECGFKCILTNKRFDIIHHKHGLDSIIEETFELIKLPKYEKTSDYTKEELKLIKNTCIQLHNKYGLGVCLTKEVHDLFHKTYKYGNNTLDQWNQFEQDFKAGKYIEGIDY